MPVQDVNGNRVERHDDWKPVAGLSGNESAIHVPHSIKVPSKIMDVKPVIKAFEYQLVHTERIEDPSDKKKRSLLVYDLKNCILTRATYDYFNEEKIQ